MHCKGRKIPASISQCSFSLFIAFQAHSAWVRSMAVAVLPRSRPFLLPQPISRVNRGRGPSSSPQCSPPTGRYRSPKGSAQPPGRSSAPRSSSCRRQADSRRGRARPGAGTGSPALDLLLLRFRLPAYAAHAQGARSPAGNWTFRFGRSARPTTSHLGSSTPNDRWRSLPSTSSCTFSPVPRALAPSKSLAPSEHHRQLSLTPKARGSPYTHPILLPVRLGPRERRRWNGVDTEVEEAVLTFDGSLNGD